MKSFLKKTGICRKGFGIRVILAGCFVVCMLSSCRKEESFLCQSVDTAMGTVLRQSIYLTESSTQDETERVAQEITRGVREEIGKQEAHWLSRRLETSAVYEINGQAGAKQAIPADSYLTDLLQKIWQVSADSDGALDITIGEVVKLWDIDTYAIQQDRGIMDQMQTAPESFAVPRKDELKKMLEVVGYEKVSIEDGAILLPEGMSLDLGAVGKGIACDSVLAYLEQQPKVLGAVIAIGGSIATYGSKPDGTAWNVGIINPNHTSAYIGSLRLHGQWCVSTSGDYERYVEVDGVRYHHIMDPSTGYPADAGLRSVTILSKDGCLSDALSTAVFVLGAQKGLALVEQYNAYAVLVDTQGQVLLSAGTEAYFAGAEGQ